MTDINVGAITEALNDKSDRDLRNVDTTAKADAVIDYQEPTADNGYTWYRKYKSGWVEQGGQRTVDSNGVEITLPVVMADSNYCVQITTSQNVNSFCRCYTRTTTYVAIATSGYSLNASWQVCGMAA
jgi:hypothetical protein